jgi:hypothetical protein
MPKLKWPGRPRGIRPRIRVGAPGAPLPDRVPAPCVAVGDVVGALDAIAMALTVRDGLVSTCAACGRKAFAAASALVASMRSAAPHRTRTAHLGTLCGNRLRHAMLVPLARGDAGILSGAAGPLLVHLPSPTASSVPEQDAKPPASCQGGLPSGRYLRSPILSGTICPATARTFRTALAAVLVPIATRRIRLSRCAIHMAISPKVRGSYARTRMASVTSHLTAARAAYSECH